MKKRLITEIICGLLVLLFVYTALSKLLQFESFARTLRLSPLIGELNVITGWSVVVTELILSFLLFIPRFRLADLYGAFLLLCLFTLYMGYLLLFEQDNLPCSCGGVLQQMSWHQHLVFNLFFTLLSYCGMQLQKNIQRFIAIKSGVASAGGTGRGNRKPV